MHALRELSLGAATRGSPSHGDAQACRVHEKPAEAGLWEGGGMGQLSAACLSRKAVASGVRTPGTEPALSERVRACQWLARAIRHARRMAQQGSGAAQNFLELLRVSR